MTTTGQGDNMLQTYRQFRPTCFDSAGLGCDGQQDWFVAPVSVTRDSGPLDISNWESLQAILKDAGAVEGDAEDGDFEIHRFGHWGPGWFEIILVRPGSRAQVVAEDCARRLADYPVLDEEAHSQLEYDGYLEAWESYGRRDFIDGVCSELDCENGGPVWETLDCAPAEVLRELFEACNGSGDHYYSESSGVCVNLKSSIRGVTRDDVAAFVWKHRAGRVRYPKS